MDLSTTKFTLPLWLLIATWTQTITCCTDFDADCALVQEIRDSDVITFFTHLCMISRQTWFWLQGYFFQPTLADTFCNNGAKDYCPVACNKCNADGMKGKHCCCEVSLLRSNFFTETFIMLVGGQTTKQKQPNRKPWFFSLNPTVAPLPACLTGNKNNVDNKLRNRPALILGHGIVGWQNFMDVFYVVVVILVYHFFQTGDHLCVVEQIMTENVRAMRELLR